MEHRKERRRNEQRDSTPTQGLRRISQSNPKRIGEGEGFPKTKKELLLKYHVNNSVMITNDQPYCIFGNVPTLWAANNIYGKGTAEEWLVYQFSDLSEFAGVSKKINSQQLLQMAQLMVADFGYLKMTEVMLFIRHFKVGRYGTFYGNVDPLVIMDSVRKFLVERNDTIDAHYSELEIKKANADIGNEKCVSYQDYLKYHKNKKNKDG